MDSAALRCISKSLSVQKRLGCPRDRSGLPNMASSANAQGVHGARGERKGNFVRTLVACGGSPPYIFLHYIDYSFSHTCGGGIPPGGIPPGPPGGIPPSIFHASSLAVGRLMKWIVDLVCSGLFFASDSLLEPCSAMGDSQESGGSGQGNRRALGMQDWTMWPQYLNEALWGKIMDYEGYRSLDALQLVVSHLHSLGLRHPSEPTQASLTAVLVLRELEHAQRKMLGSDNGRSLYLTVKASLHSKLQKLKHGEAPLTPAEYIVELPAQVTEAPASLQAACSPIAAPKIEMLQILKLARQIPLRNTSKELKGIQGQPETNGFEAEFRRWMGMFTMFSGMQRQESECPIQFLQPRKAQLAGMLHRAQSAEALARPHASAPLALTNDAAAHSVHGVANQALALPATVPVPDAQDAVAARAPQAAVPCPQPQAPVPVVADAARAPESAPQTEVAPNDSKKFSLMESVARYQQAKAEKGAKSDAVGCA